MTKDEFEAQYATNSGITIEQLHRWGRYAEPCDCDEPICQGWAMGHQLEDAILEDLQRQHEQEVLSTPEVQEALTSAITEYETWRTTITKQP